MSVRSSTTDVDQGNGLVSFVPKAEVDRGGSRVSVGRHMHLLSRRDAKLGLAGEKIFWLDIPIEVNFRG
jgi:hypothetical protein